MSSELRNEKLDFWIKHNLNVLFVGSAGVGKTARVIQAFERNKLKWKYFSAATMDPWVDFIGIPRVVENGTSRHLELVLPKEFQDDSIEAIFMDEFNRSHKKVRNAVMELIQFKSVNGRPFKNLKIIWAAINPEEEGTYQVEPLDPAQKDRFHVQIKVPYKPCREWFAQKYTEKIAKSAIDWWEGLPAETKLEVTPRRLEYALSVYAIKGGDMKDILPHGCNVSKLITTLNMGPAIDRLLDLYNAKDIDATKKYLQIENNFAAASRYLHENPKTVIQKDWMLFFLQNISSEKLSSLISNNEVIAEHVFANSQVPLYHSVMTAILKAGTNRKLTNRIKKLFGSPKTMSNQLGNMQNANTTPPFFNKGAVADWSKKITALSVQPMNNTHQRIKIYNEMVLKIPELLTAQEAVDTLGLLNVIARRCWASTLIKDLNNLLGVVNHCIAQINKTTNLAWAEILTVYGIKFDKLIQKIVEAGLRDKLLCPVKPTTTSAFDKANYQAKIQDLIKSIKSK